MFNLKILADCDKDVTQEIEIRQLLWFGNVNKVVSDRWPISSRYEQCNSTA